MMHKALSKSLWSPLMSQSEIMRPPKLTQHGKMFPFKQQHAAVLRYIEVNSPLTKMARFS
jgi:hypothetical protein